MLLREYLVSIFLPGLVSALGQPFVISFSKSSGSVTLAAQGVSPSILIDNGDWAGVVRAANDLATDFGLVTGLNGTVTQTTSLAANANLVAPMIVIGTIGRSKLIDTLVQEGKIDVSRTKGQWEAFHTQLVTNVSSSIPHALVVAGSDKRGSIYGAYDISEQIGVSPWYWWADVPAQRRTNVYALNVTKIQASPTVKYRGLFLNDEQPALNNWVQSNYEGVTYLVDGVPNSGPGFNHKFYSTVFELLLRLRANYLWPASWNSMFNVDDLENQPLADQYGIVMGTSHTEPMMRATKEQSLYLNGTWAWATNEPNVLDFMRYGAQRAKPYESLYSMGMRGLGDTASPTLNASSLEQILQHQQQILMQVNNETDISSVPQMWCLYKEVGGYYADGLSVPEDITILWSDDNWGNPERLPLANETQRAAGSGVYYHFDYVGDPRDYKWINTINLQKTWEQMQLSYNRGARQIWILNVGDLKPLELPISHFMDLAYDATMWASPNSTMLWQEAWASQQFGSDSAAEISAVMMNYSMLAGRRKYELVDPTTYSLINYNEADTVLQEWSVLVDSAEKIYTSLSTSAQPAFFEMVLHPALAGSTLHQIYVDVAKNNLYTEQERTSANQWAQVAMNAFSQDSAITTAYHTLLNGKWNHMMDQTHVGYYYWQQPMRNSLPGLGYTQAKQVSVAGTLGVTCEGQNGTVPGDDQYHTLSTDSLSVPPMDPYGPSTRWIDIFSRGTGPFDFEASPNNSYVTVKPSSGSLSGAVNETDVRLYISVDWPKVPTGSSVETINVTTTSQVISGNYGNYNMPTILVPLNKTAAPNSFHGFVESDATISIEPQHFTTNKSSRSAYFEVIPGYGRTLSGVTLLPATAPSQSLSGGPKLTYDFYTFTPSVLANVSVYIGPSLNTDPTRPLMYAISVDDEKPQSIQPIPTTQLGTLPDMWTDMVSNATTFNTTSHSIKKGSHTLNLWALEPAITFQKIVMDLGGVRQSYLGPPESMII